VRRFIITALAAAAVALASPAIARGPDWQLLGEQSVGFGVDRDVIRVNQNEEWFRNRSFRALHLEVANNDVHMMSVRLIYMNGHAENIPIDRLIRAGDNYDLSIGGERSYLREIELTYRSRPSFRGQAVVRIYGEPARRGGGDIGGRGDWTVLGEQSVGFSGERDVIRVGRVEGRFSRIRLEVSDNDVFLRSVRVRYRDGSTDEWELRQEIRAGDRSQALDLSGDRRAIEEVELSYRARPGFGGRARVVVLGDRGNSDGRGLQPTSSRGDERRAPEPRMDSRASDLLRNFNSFGRQNVDSRDDRVVFDIGPAREPQETLVLVAHDRPVQVREVEITFRSGDRQRVGLDELLEPGRPSRVIDLEGSRRALARVVVFVRSEGRRGGELELMASQSSMRALGVDRWR